MKRRLIAGVTGAAVVAGMGLGIDEATVSNSSARLDQAVKDKS